MIADTHDTMTEVTTEINTEVTAEVTPIPPMTKKEARLEQLAKARLSGVAKKRERESDLQDMKAKLDSISETLLARKKPDIEVADDDEPAPVSKRQRVTKEPVEQEEQEETPSSDTWTTSIVRTSAVLSLGAASWWFQNRYGKKSEPPVIPTATLKKTTTKTPTTSLLPNRTKNRNSMIGHSGFAVS
jgi:Skp family chaperone for outer membrane proteins